MTEFGTVLDVKGEFATVRIGRNSACASCGKCGMTEGQKHVDFFAANDVGAAVGDTVEVALPETSATKLALVGYILPLVPALSLLFVSLALGWAEWLALLLLNSSKVVVTSLILLIINSFHFYCITAD